MTTSDQIPIGEAARRLGVATSALRYYDERGIVHPARRVAGRRVYGLDELRRLAFVQMLQRLGVDLDTIAATLDDSGHPWPTVVDTHLRWLEDRISRAEQARRVLAHAKTCPHERPWRDCSYLLEVLDAWLGDEGGPNPVVNGTAAETAGLPARWPDPWPPGLAPDTAEDAEPLERFGRWLHDALLTEPDPHAVSLATANAVGAPSVTSARFERLTDGDFVITTRQDFTPWGGRPVALLFAWRGTRREVRVTGAARRIDGHRYRIPPETIEFGQLGSSGEDRPGPG